MAGDGLDGGIAGDGIGVSPGQAVFVPGLGGPPHLSGQAAFSFIQPTATCL